jgi:hypothetical protein
MVGVVHRPVAGFRKVVFICQDAMAGMKVFAPWTFAPGVRAGRCFAMDALAEKLSIRTRRARTPPSNGLDLVEDVGRPAVSVRPVAWRGLSRRDEYDAGRLGELLEGQRAKRTCELAGFGSKGAVEFDLWGRAESRPLIDHAVSPCRARSTTWGSFTPFSFAFEVVTSEEPL